MSQAGIEKSAALLLALGEEATAAVFRYLSPLEVSRLGAAMREMGVLPRERVRLILRDYAAEAAEQTGFATDAGRFLDDSLKLAWSPERAQAMLQRLGSAGGQAQDKLAGREPAEIAGLLEEQPPQLIAMVLAQLPRDVAAAVLDALPGSARAETLLSLAHSDTVCTSFDGPLRYPGFPFHWTSDPTMAEGEGASGSLAKLGVIGCFCGLINGCQWV